MEIGAGRAVTPAAERAFACLLRLVLSHGRPVPRATLGGLLWPDAKAPAARHALRQLLYRLRRLGVPLTVDAERVALPAAHVTRTADVAPSCEALRASLALEADGWRVGPWLPRYAPEFSPAFACWLDAERSVIEGRLRRALDVLLLESGATAPHYELERIAMAVLALDPLHAGARSALGGLARRGRDASRCQGQTSDATLAEAGDGDASSVVCHLASDPAAQHFAQALIRRLRDWGIPVVQLAASGEDATDGSLAIETASALLGVPGAIGCAPEALIALRDWLTRARGRAQAEVDLPPAHALAELLAAIADEGPHAIVLEVHAPARIPWSLLSLLRRTSHASRTLVIVTRAEAIPRERPERGASRYSPPKHPSPTATDVPRELANQGLPSYRWRAGHRPGWSRERVHGPHDATT